MIYDTGDRNENVCEKLRKFRKQVLLTIKCLVYVDLLVIIPFPFHTGLRRAGRLAGQGFAGALSNNDVAAAQ